MNVVTGTHLGRLDDEAKARRRAKNARNANRRGQATRPPGSQKRVLGRLFTKGNRVARGLGS